MLPSRGLVRLTCQFVGFSGLMTEEEIMPRKLYVFSAAVTRNTDLRQRPNKKQRKGVQLLTSSHPLSLSPPLAKFGKER